MPSFCAVVGCGNKASKTVNVSFYRIPAAEVRGSDAQKKLSRNRREKWIQALRRADLTESKIKYARICSLHFHSGKPAELHDVDNPDWAPSVQMGYSSTSQAVDSKRYIRAKQRRKWLDKPNTTSSEPVVDDVPPTELPVSQAKPTYEELEEALAKANEEIRELKNELKQYKMEEEHFEEHEEDVLYFTGFPEYTYLKNLFDAVEPHLPPRKKISKFHQLLMTLIKLRLNFDYTYLAKIFQCHRTTVGRIVEQVIDVLYHRLKSFIVWPSRENLIINMPQCFKNVFGNKVTVIIDCFEVFIEKPSSLDAAAMTWSNYKHHHTMKFLIGISPQGCVIFISNAYGGRASDKFITDNSGFLDNLIPGDLVIADRGFAIDDSVALYLAEVRYPAFLKHKKQLNVIEIEKTRKLASVRINVERVIGLLKGKFNILQGIFPLIQLKKGDNEFAFIDKIITVCCCIINLCPGIVSIED